MTTPDPSSTSPVLRFRYGAGWACAATGAGVVLISLLASREMLSPDTQWHLWSTDTPFIIPNVVMQVAWWLMFLIGLIAFMSSALPSASVVLRTDSISVMHPLTRSITEIPYANIRDIAVTDNGILISGVSGKTWIARLFVGRSDYARIQEELRKRTAADVWTD